MDGHTERALLERCRRGDRAAFTPIVEAYRAPVITLLSQMSGDAEEAADLAQETFAKVWQKLSSYDPARSFRSWLYAVARNLCRDAYRHSQTGPTQTNQAFERMARIPDPGRSPEADLLAKERRERVWQALQRLNPLDRDVLVFREIEDRTYDEIAELLKIPGGTVASRLYHARRALKDELEEPEVPAAGSLSTPMPAG